MAMNWYMLYPLRSDNVADAAGHTVEDINQDPGLWTARTGLNKRVPYGYDLAYVLEWAGRIHGDYDGLSWYDENNNPLSAPGVCRYIIRSWYKFRNFITADQYNRVVDRLEWLFTSAVSKNGSWTTGIAKRISRINAEHEFEEDYTSLMQSAHVQPGDPILASHIDALYADLATAQSFYYPYGSYYNGFDISYESGQRIRFTSGSYSDHDIFPRFYVNSAKKGKIIHASISTYKATQNSPYTGGFSVAISASNSNTISASFVYNALVNAGFIVSNPYQCGIQLGLCYDIHQPLPASEDIPYTPPS